jgi:hypothetical protein
MWTQTPTDRAAAWAVQLLTSVAAGGKLDVDVRRELARLSPAAWESALALIEENRLLGRVGQSLRHRGLDGALPPEPRRRLRRAAEEKSSRNSRRMARYARVAAALRREGVEPIVLKSAALVALLHPTQDAHEMSDVDIYVRPDDLATTERVLVDAGLSAVERLDHAIDYRDADDLLRVDLHHRFEMFGERDLYELTIEIPTDSPGIPTMRVLAPDAMLAHLAVHLNEHRDRLGYRLRWMCDLALALAIWRSDFRWEGVAALLPDERHRLWVARTVGFCHRSWGVALPPGLAPWAEALEPFTIGEVLRSQRVKPWRLDGMRAWVRLAATAAGRDLRALEFGPPAREPATAIDGGTAAPAPALPFAAPAAAAAERE